MVKRKFITYLLFMFLSSLVLIACSPETITKNYAIVQADGTFPLGVSDQGALTVRDGLIWLYDFESEQNIIACNLPDCPHEAYHPIENPDPICLATNPEEGRIAAVSMYDDNIYMFNYEGIEETTVYQIDLSNSNRTRLASIDWQLSTMNDFELKDDYAYFIAERFIYEEENPSSSDIEYAVMSLDLVTGETEQHGEIKADERAEITSFKKIKDAAYYTYSYEDEDNNLHHFFYELDLHTNEERVVLDLIELDETLAFYDEEYIYFISEDNTEFIAMDWDLSESEVLFTGENIQQRHMIPEEGIIYTQQPADEAVFDHTYYYYNLESQEIHSFKRSSSEIPVFTVFDGWIFTRERVRGSLPSQIIIDQEDYLEGETNYIYLGPTDSED